AAVGGRRLGGRRARGRVDPLSGRLAAHDGERRPDGGSRRASGDGGRCGEGAGMTAISERTSLDLALERATARLLQLQHPSGWWVGELESNATMIAQH